MRKKGVSHIRKKTQIICGLLLSRQFVGKNICLLSRHFVKYLDNRQIFSRFLGNANLVFFVLENQLHTIIHVQSRLTSIQNGLTSIQNRLTTIQMVISIQICLTTDHGLLL